MAERVSLPICDFDDPLNKIKIPGFIKNYQENPGRPFDDEQELKFWRRKDILIPNQTMKISSKVYTVNLLSSSSSSSPVDDQKEENDNFVDDVDDVLNFWKEKDYRERSDTLELIENCFNDEDDKKDEEVEYLNQDKCFYLGSILNYSFECKALMNASDDVGYSSIENEYPKEYRNSERALIKSKKLADLLWNRIK